MARYATNKMISLVTLVVMFFLFFIWLVGQIQDFAYFFGFRLSDVVSSDVGSLLTALGGVPGQVTYHYQQVTGSSASSQINYDTIYLNNMVCIKSTWSNQKISTTDCSAVPSYESSLPKNPSSSSQFVGTFVKDYVGNAVVISSG